MKRLQHRDRLVIETRKKKSKKKFKTNKVRKPTFLNLLSIFLNLLSKIKRFHKFFGDCKYNAFIAQILSDRTRIRLKVSPKKRNTR